MRVAGSNKLAVFLLQRLLPRRLATSLLTKASYDSSGHPRPEARETALEKRGVGRAQQQWTSYLRAGVRHAKESR